MAFKLSNEAKIGVLVIVSILILIFGFNFLRGKGFFNTDVTYHTFFDNTGGLQEAASVQLQGVKVGKVSKVTLQADRKVKVEFLLRNDIPLVEGVFLEMGSDNLLAGTKSLYLVFPETSNASAKVIPSNGFVPNRASADLMSSITGNISPLLGTANKAVSSIDSVLLSINSIVSEDARLHINKSLIYLEQTMADMSKLANALSQQSNNMAGVLNNANSITNNLSKSNADISQTLHNLNSFTNQLKEAPLDKAIVDLQKTIGNLNSVMSKVNSTDGSVGLLMNDPKLYENLSSTLKSLDELMVDLQKRPSRYINVSVFGRKEKVAK